MTIPLDHILVLGHRNPDTDASTSAAAYAAFLERSRAYSSPITAGVAGELPPQSLVVLRKAQMEPPPVVADLLPRVGDVATREVRALREDDRYGHAVEELIRSGASMLPVLGPDGSLKGVFSHRRDAGRYLLGLDVVPILGSLLRWEDLAGIPGARLIGPPPADGAIHGQLRLALEGEDWRSRLEPDDVLLCGDLRAALELPGGPPRRVVLAAPGEPAAGDVERLLAAGTSLIAYRHSALDFLFGLLPQVRVGSLSLDVGPCLGEMDLLQDVEELVTTSRHALPVMARDGSLAGVVSRSDLDSPPRRRVILIDHFESAQAVPGLEHAEILEILDHHRVGDLETAAPVRVECRPIGSSSTIVALRYLESGLELDRSTAVLLLGGLVSDTLCLRSPTATPVDRSVAERLARIVGEGLSDFGRAVLRAGDDLLTAEPGRIWNRDQKAFGIRNRTFAVAQLETVALDDLSPQTLLAFRRELEEDFARGSHLLSLLFLTDVLRGESWVAACESRAAEGITAACWGTERPREGWTLARGVVSRKKQIVPRLLAALSEVRF